MPNADGMKVSFRDRGGGVSNVRQLRARRDRKGVSVRDRGGGVLKHNKYDIFTVGYVSVRDRCGGVSLKTKEEGKVSVRDRGGGATVNQTIFRKSATVVAELQTLSKCYCIYTRFQSATLVAEFQTRGL